MRKKSTPLPSSCGTNFLLESPSSFFVFFFLAHREMAFLLYLRTLARGSKEEFPKRTIAPGKKQKHLVLESHKKKSGGGGKDMRQEMGQ